MNFSLLFLCMSVVLNLMVISCDSSMPGSSEDQDGSTDTDADSDVDSNADADGDADTDTDADGDSDADGDTDADGDADTDTDADGDSDADGDADTDTDADGDSDADGDTDADGDSDADSDTDTGNDTSSDSDSDSFDPLNCSDIGKWNQNPPCGLEPSQVPMFVAIGFDDNTSAAGMSWVLSMAAARQNPDGTPIGFSFYINTSAAADAGSTWVAAMDAGHEIGNHTHSHTTYSGTTEEQWEQEIVSCNEGFPNTELEGFRAPYLEYNGATFDVLTSLGLKYDCSIEEGYQWDQDGTNYCWPYDMSEGSPGNEVLVSEGLKQPIGEHPGLWELPVHPVIAPPDDKCEQYGIPEGLRDTLADRISYFDKTSGKITGLDYNLYAQSMFELSKAEFVATLKYTYDLRKNNNRAPFMFGAHSQYYTNGWNQAPNMTTDEQKEAMEEFVDYVLQDDFARIVPMKSILQWCKTPSPL